MTWSDWEDLGGVLTSAPAVAAWGANRLDTFVKGTDNHMWHKVWDGAAWSGWEDLGGVLTSAPAVAAWGANRLDTFVKGTDNHMWHKWWDGAAWSGWEDLGGVLTSAPAVAAWGANRLDTFVKGTDNHMWHKWWDGAAWSGWEDLGGVLTSAPAVAAWGANRLDTFVKGTDNHMWHKVWDGAAWSDWEDLGGVLTSAPAVAAWGANRLDTFVKGTDNHMWHKVWDGAAAAMLVRRDIWSLERNNTWDPTTLAYARAVAELQQRPATDPTSWTYLAAVHGTTTPQPAGADWNLCQHGSWYFLPWHRMYLHYFERVVRSVVIAQGGPADWALPFWNYNAGGGTNVLPPAFRQQNLPDGTANPLFVTQRGAGVNQGGGLPASITSAAAALGLTAFTPPPPPGFGGGRTTPQHFFGLAGELEFTPHNDVHSVLGGWMGNANLAALDPIFWLHHSNIDRLWSVWLERGGRANPNDASWLDEPFVFHDETGARVTLTAAGVLDSAGQLGYVYEAVTTPEVAPELPEVAVSEASPGEPSPPELLGATDTPVVLVGQPESVEVPVDPQTRQEREQVAESGQLSELYLNIEDVEAEANPSVAYGVYVNIADDAAADPGDATHYVGNVSFFGIEHVPRSDELPHGFRRTFRITDIEQRLREAGTWSEDAVRVSFRPIGLELPEGVEFPEAGAEATPAVRIGRVSLFYG